MSQYKLGWWVTNLLIPGDPDRVFVEAQSGRWAIVRSDSFNHVKHSIKTRSVNTHTLETQLHPDACNERGSISTAFDDMLAICLAASYLCGQTVSPTTSLQSSCAQYISIGDKFPKHRPISVSMPMHLTSEEYLVRLQQMVKHILAYKPRSHIILIIQLWLDVLSSSSLEGAILNLASLLEVIIAMSKHGPRSDLLGLAEIPDILFANAEESCIHSSPLPIIWQMRDNLIHGGALCPTGYDKSSIAVCADAVSEWMNVVDRSIAGILDVAGFCKPRFSDTSFLHMNSFSLG